MRHFKAAVAVTVMLLVGASIVLGGCSAARKPSAPPYPAKSPAPARQMSAQQIADRTVAEAEKVTDVRNAYAFVTGKSIYMGLDLNSGIDRNRTASVEENVMNRIKAIEPGYSVAVSSDPDLVTRIRRVSTGIAQGKPLNSLDSEIKNIISRLRPRSQ